MTINPDELRQHADLILKGDVPLIRGAALLREAADAMQGFYDTRALRHAELYRLYEIEKAARKCLPHLSRNIRSEADCRQLEAAIAAAKP